MTQNSGFSRMRCLSLPTAIFLPILMVCVAMLFSDAPLKAQVQNGIDGTVTDPSGAVIVGAHVTATNNSYRRVASVGRDLLGRRIYHRRTRYPETTPSPWRHPDSRPSRQT